MAHLERGPCQGAAGRARALVGGTLGLLLLGAVGAAAPALAQAPEVGVPEGTATENGQTGSIGPGTVVEVPSSEVSYTPTAAQVVAHQLLMEAKASHLAPPLGPNTTASEVAVDGGPETYAAISNVPNSFTVFTESLINSKCSGCAFSDILEPTAANSGKTVFVTSNWNLAYTLNGGASPITWLNLNPYTLSSGFCCDSEVVYDPDRDIYLILLLDYAGEGAATNGFTLAIARSSTPTSWCRYKFTGANFGEGATDTLDYPKIVVSNNNAFITWNDYPPHSAFKASELVRLPLDSLAACSSVSYIYIARNTEFTFALARGPSAHDQFYWVSNWMLDGTVNGSHLRIFHWPDNGGTYFWNTVAINAYHFGTVACGSPNWCSRLDPRYESVVITPAEYRGQANSAFAGDDILEVATQAGPSSFSNGNNYIVYNYFKLHSLSYIGNDQTYNTVESFAYAGCGVNEKGYVGCAESVGKNAPGGIIILQDNVNPTQPWGYDFVLNGVNGASAWGDYIETNPWRPSGGPFQTVLWYVNASNAVEPYYIVWGRGSDANDFSRWKSQ